MYTNFVRKNVTFSADGDLIQQARQRASAENTTLQKAFQQWLERYCVARIHADGFGGLMERLGYAQSGGRFSRDDLNERRSETPG